MELYVTCPTEAIKLIERPKSDQDIPPEDYIDWSKQRAASRGIAFEE